MNISDIRNNRLANQNLSITTFTKPQQIVSHLVAMQAQEFAHAKWAIGLRTKNVTDSDIEQAFNDGKFLRTHLMRPTWHFVAPADIRWLLALTKPRVHALNAYMYRQLELDKKILARCNNLLAKALRDGKHLTRKDLQSVLQGAKISANGLRLGYIMMNAELEAVICSGPRKGKQFTYALLDERVPSVPSMDREESLLQFAERYFSSRGPATVNDFSYWSGLSMRDALFGAKHLPSHFKRIMFMEKEYIFCPHKNKTVSTTFLMPMYDEFGMSYKDRTSMIGPQSIKADSFSYFIVSNGMIVGTWKREMKKNSVEVETQLMAHVMKSKHRELAEAVKRYHLFAEPVDVS